eukprot:scaffold1243_cov403-Prasinococcus_capsulatus_cf.AAC.22
MARRRVHALSTAGRSLAQTSLAGCELSCHSCTAGRKSVDSIEVFPPLAYSPSPHQLLSAAPQSLQRGARHRQKH